MNKKSKIIVLLLIGIFLVFSFWREFKHNTEIRKIMLLQDSMSSAVLYALNNNKIDSAKIILTSNLTNVVFRYDKALFEESKGLSHFCENWKKFIRKVVVKDIQNKEYNNTSYKTKVLENIKLMDNDCIKD